MDDMCNRGKFSSYWPRKESETELGRPNKPYNGGGTPQGFRKKHTHRCMRRYLQERGWCQRIYLGVSRRKKKDKQRRADLEMEREESEEATLPKRSSRSARGAGREQRRVTLQRRRRQPAADKTKLLEAGGSTLVGQRPKENDHKHSKRSKEKG